MVYTIKRNYLCVNMQRRAFVFVRDTLSRQGIFKYKRKLTMVWSLGNLATLERLESNKAVIFVKLILVYLSDGEL